MNAINVVPNGDLLVSSDVLNIKSDAEHTTYYEISSKTLKVKNKYSPGGVSASNSILYMNGNVYVADGSNVKDTNYGSTITERSPKTFKVIKKFSIGKVPNLLIPIPDSHLILAMKYYPNAELNKPYASLLDTKSQTIKPWNGIPESAAETFVGKNLWCITDSGEIEAFKIGSSKPIWSTKVKLELDGQRFFPSAMVYMK